MSSNSVIIPSNVEGGDKSYISLYICIVLKILKSCEPRRPLSPSKITPKLDEDKRGIVTKISANSWGQYALIRCTGLENPRKTVISNNATLNTCIFLTSIYFYNNVQYLPILVFIDSYIIPLIQLLFLVKKSHVPGRKH